MIAERFGVERRLMTYAVVAANAIGQGLLDRGPGLGEPLLLIPPGSTVDHLLAMLGAITARIPVVSASAACSLQRRDHAPQGDGPSTALSWHPTLSRALIAQEP
jgi:hypothetical protein